VPSSSADDISPRESWLQERRDDALARFDQKIPAIYQQAIDIDPRTAEWIAGWTATSLFLTGPIGVGKTHTAWRTCRRWLEAAYAIDRPWKGSPVIATYRSTTLFDALRPDADGDSRNLVAQLQRADLLFIDDLAAARASTWTQERLFEIFDERYINRRPVIITCDVLPSQLSEITGPRVASRLAEMCRGGVLLLQGDDRRKQAAA
jgi:DNA replication protein DnaC